MTPSPAEIASRIAASLLGGYALVWGFANAGIALGVAAGMPYGEARTLLHLLAFLLFLTVFCWAFAASTARRVWSVLGGGGAVLSTGAWLLVRHLS